MGGFVHKTKNESRIHFFLYQKLFPRNLAHGKGCWCRIQDYLCSTGKIGYLIPVVLE